MFSSTSECQPHSGLFKLGMTYQGQPPRRDKTMVDSGGVSHANAGPTAKRGSQPPRSLSTCRLRIELNQRYMPVISL